MTTAPWIQEPIYDQGPMTGNAIMAWILAHNDQTYLDNTGTAFNLPQPGQWAPDPAAPPIPRGDGTFIANDPQNPNQRWTPDPTVADNPIWQAGTLYGKDGYDYFDLSPLAKEVLAGLKANPTPIPAAILNPPPRFLPPPPPPVYSPPPPPPGFLAWLAEYLRYHG